jgi:hypothetical protein
MAELPKESHPHQKRKEKLLGPGEKSIKNSFCRERAYHISRIRLYHYML